MALPVLQRAQLVRIRANKALRLVCLPAGPLLVSKGQHDGAVREKTSCLQLMAPLAPEGYRTLCLRHPFQLMNSNA